MAAGLVLTFAAWSLPANLKSTNPALLREAGQGTPTLGGFGRDLVDLEKLGPAALVLAAAQATDDPRAPALAIAIGTFATKQPGLATWGGWDPFLDPLFNLRADTGRRGSTPVLAFLIPRAARDKLRASLANSGSLGVQAVMRTRELTATGRFAPATRPGGQPLDAIILLTGLLYQGERLAPPLQRELRGLAEAAVEKKELGAFTVVNNMAPNPQVTGITPGLLANGVAQTATITGSNFVVSGATTAVIFMDPGGGLHTCCNAGAPTISSTSIAARPAFGVPGTWSVKVTNSAGGDSGWFAFRVN